MVMPKNKDELQIKRTWDEWISTVGGIGFIGKAPGTWASLITLPLAFFLNQTSPTLYMIFTFVVVLVGIISSQAYENRVGEHDNSEIVIDEVAGQLITLVWIPNTISFYLGGFLLFRLFDIWKPGPIGLLDRKVKGGAGVMADDILAGIVSGIILQFFSQSQVWAPQWAGQIQDLLQKFLR